MNKNGSLSASEKGRLEKIADMMMSKGSGPEVTTMRKIGQAALVTMIILTMCVVTGAAVWKVTTDHQVRSKDQLRDLISDLRNTIDELENPDRDTVETIPWDIVEPTEGYKVKRHTGRRLLSVEEGIADHDEMYLWCRSHHQRKSFVESTGDTVNDVECQHRVDCQTAMLTVNKALAGMSRCTTGGPKLQARLQQHFTNQQRLPWNFALLRKNDGTENDITTSEKVDLLNCINDATLDDVTSVWQKMNEAYNNRFNKVQARMLQSGQRDGFAARGNSNSGEDNNTDGAKVLASVVKSKDDERFLNVSNEVAGDQPVNLEEAAPAPVKMHGTGIRHKQGQQTYGGHARNCCSPDTQELRLSLLSGNGLWPYNEGICWVCKRQRSSYVGLPSDKRSGNLPEELSAFKLVCVLVRYNEKH